MHNPTDATQFEVDKPSMIRSVISMVLEKSKFEMIKKLGEVNNKTNGIS